MCKSVVQRTAIKKHIIYINIDVCMSCMYVCTEGTCSKKVVDCFILYNIIYYIFNLCTYYMSVYLYIYVMHVCTHMSTVSKIDLTYMYTCKTVLIFNET